MVELAKSMEEGRMAELEELHLDSNKISGVGLQALARALSKGALPKLREIYLGGHEFALHETRGAGVWRHGVMREALMQRPAVYLRI